MELGASKLIEHASHLLLLQLSQPPNSTSDRCSGGGRITPCTSSNGDSAILVMAEPDADSHSLHFVLSAESTQEFGMLRYFHFLDSLPETCTISGTVFTSDTNLLSPLGHFYTVVYFSCRSESSNISL